VIKFQKPNFADCCVKVVCMCAYLSILPCGYFVLVLLLAFVLLNYNCNKWELMIIITVLTDIIIICSSSSNHCCSDNSSSSINYLLSSVNENIACYRPYIPYYTKNYTSNIFHNISAYITIFLMIIHWIVPDSKVRMTFVFIFLTVWR
jgi:hypothetical protein